jgi:hypothetical protein
MLYDGSQPIVKSNAADIRSERDLQLQEKVSNRRNQSVTGELRRQKRLRKGPGKAKEPTVGARAVSSNFQTQSQQALRSQSQRQPACAVG